MHLREGDSELTLFGLLQCLDSSVVLICSTIQSNSAPYRHLAVASRAAAACIAHEQTHISIHCCCIEIAIIPTSSTMLLEQPAAECCSVKTNDFKIL